MNVFRTLCAYRVAPILLAASLTVLLSADGPAIEDKTVEVAGDSLHYLEAGAGPPLVLLHGLGADVRVWRFAIPVFAGSFHVYALDQIGFGQSDKPEIQYRVGTLVDSLTGFLDAVHVEKTSLIGNSLGGSGPQRATGMWTNLSLSRGPASSTTTKADGSALSRFATTDPAEPVPTTM